MLFKNLLILFFIILLVRSFLQSFNKNPFSVIEGMSSKELSNTEVPQEQSGILKSMYDNLREVDVMKLNDKLSDIENRVSRLVNKNYPAIHENKKIYYELEKEKVSKPSF